MAPPDNQFGSLDLGLMEEPEHIKNASAFMLFFDEYSEYRNYLPEIYLRVIPFSAMALRMGGAEVRHLTEKGDYKKATSLVRASDEYDRLSPDQSHVGVFIFGPSALEITDALTILKGIAEGLNGRLDKSSGGTIVDIGQSGIRGGCSRYILYSLWD